MKSERICCSALILIALTITQAARAAGDERAFVNQLDNSMREKAALTRFRGHVSPAQMGQVTLAEVFDTVANGTGLAIHIDWPALDVVGLTRETPVKVDRKTMSYGDYLNTVCTALGVQLVLSFRQPADQFCLTTSAASPAAMPAETGENNKAERIALLGGTENIATAAKLENKVAHFAFNQATIEKLIDTLRDSANLNISVNWIALQAAGIDKSSPVTIKLSGVSAKQILTEILTRAGGNAVQLGYTISGGVIEVSTTDELNSTPHQVTHVFNIRRLLTGFQPGTSQYDEAVKKITDTIKTVVAPDSWRDAGGQVGSMRELNGQLIINQTAGNHVAILDLLRQIKSPVPPKN